MEKETKKILGKIRSIRKEKEISLLNLALEVEISHSHLYYIESNKVIPSIDVVVKLSKALGIDMKDLVD